MKNSISPRVLIASISVACLIAVVVIVSLARDNESITMKPHPGAKGRFAALQTAAPPDASDQKKSADK